MEIEDMESFQAGIKVLEDAASEIQEDLWAIDGICKQCAEDDNRQWPGDTSMYCSGPCHSCGEKTDTVLVPYDDLAEHV